MYTLVLEASTAAGSVALLRDSIVRQSRAVAMGASRVDTMFPAVIEMLGAEGIEASAIGEVVCGEGPGSFTSLRIAGAIAKGIAQANAVPLFAIPSLLLAAAAHETAGAYLVHADALRGERYAMPVHLDDDGVVHADGPVVRVTSDAIGQLAGARDRLSVLTAVDADEDTVVQPFAAHLEQIANWRALGTVDLAQWEPAYGRLAEAQVKWEAAHAQTVDAALAKARDA